MSETATRALSRRSATLLAAALLATFATALGTIGGLSHWAKQAAPGASTPAPAQIVHQAPATQWADD
jgi:hypothetical protein